MSSRWIRLNVDFEQADFLMGEPALVRFAWVKLLTLIESQSYVAGQIKCTNAKQLAYAFRFQSDELWAVERLLEVAQAGDDPAITIQDGILMVANLGAHHPTSAERTREYRNRKKHADPEAETPCDVTKHDVTSVTHCDIRKQEETVVTQCDVTKHDVTSVTSRDECDGVSTREEEKKQEEDINNYNLGGERGGVGGENHSEESPPCGASPAAPDSPPGRGLVQRASSPRRKPGGDSKLPEPVMGQGGLPERVVHLAPKPPDGGVLIEPGHRAQPAHFVASEICEAMPPSHNTEAMFVAIRDYVAMRRRTRLKSWDPVTVGRKSAEWAKFPAEAVIAALEESTSNQYAGVFPAKHMPRGGKKPYDPIANARRNLEALGIDPDCMEGDDGQE